VFDRTNELNSYKDYTIVHALYCSGDVWIGNVTRPYGKDFVLKISPQISSSLNDSVQRQDDPNGSPVVQSGYYNARSTIDWIISQQSKGSLASTLSSLVVMGCSAGSIGAQVWGNDILKGLRWKTAAIVPDSYAGVFPDGTQGPLIYDFGTCTVIENFVGSELVQLCNNEELTLQDIMEELIAETPNIPYGFVQVYIYVYLSFFFLSHIS